MRRTAGIAIGVGAITLTLGLLGAGFAHASTTDESGSEGPDRPIVGAALQHASAAALAHTGQGTVTGTEVGDEESYYEVEITLDDGTEVDVQLDESFAVVGSDADSRTAD